MGAQINAAYAALPSTGGKIIIPAGTQVNMTTPIVCATAGKPVLIEGAPGKAVYLGWTGSTSASVFTFDTRANTNDHPTGLGLRGIYLQTSGANTANAVVFGSTNSGEGGIVEDCTIVGFNNTILLSGGSNVPFNISLNRTSMISCANGVNITPGSGGAEKTVIVGGLCVAPTNGAVTISGASNSSDVYVYGMSVDGPNGGYAWNVNGSVNCSLSVFGAHHENSGFGSPIYGLVQNGTLSIYGGVAVDDVNSGNFSAGPWFNVNPAGTLIIHGLSFISAGRTTTIPLIGMGGTGRLRSTVNLVTPNLFTGNTKVFPLASLTAGNVVDDSIIGSTQTLSVPAIIGTTLINTPSLNNVTLLNRQTSAAPITGTGLAATLYSYTLLGNTMGANKGIRVTCHINHSTGTASTTYTFNFGATSVTFTASATTGYGELVAEVWNNPSVFGAQVVTTKTVIGATSDARGTTSSTVDTTANVTITCTFNVAATDQVTPAGFEVELIQ